MGVVKITGEQKGKKRDVKGEIKERTSGQVKKPGMKGGD